MRTDHPSTLEMWREYLESVGESPANTDRAMVVDFFGMDRDTADELAALVLTGKKRATASALWMYEHADEALPYEGVYTIVVDGSGVAVCIVRTTRIDVVPFSEVTDEFARLEGEGDLSLEYWRTVHRSFFSEELATIGRAFEEQMPVVCEYFELVFPFG